MTKLKPRFLFSSPSYQAAKINLAGISMALKRDNDEERRARLDHLLEMYHVRAEDLAEAAKKQGSKIRSNLKTAKAQIERAKEKARGRKD